ncbi:MAG TPA: hypothetical protein DCK93_00690 [Blastocatellia bacterium]|jgi:hypothetical protein|nr:hypothetical protein [Blastocatellia bacterium]
MKWLSTHPDDQLYQRIVSEFKQVYKSANEPKDVALFEATDLFGKCVGLYLTPAAVPYCGSLFDMSHIWQECGPPSGMNISFIAGDKCFVE